MVKKPQKCRCFPKIHRRENLGSFEKVDFSSKVSGDFSRLKTSFSNLLRGSTSRDARKSVKIDQK